MLTLSITAPGGLSDTEIQLEHSLVSLSKWEAIHEKPFHGKEPQTFDETKSYFKQMLISPNVTPDIIDRLNTGQYNEISAYINSKQSATYFTDRPEPKRGLPEAITNELIYHWMIDFEIPFEPCETWHLNRLMTLIKIRGIKKTPPKKMTRQQIAEQHRALNAQRREQLGTTG